MGKIDCHFVFRAFSGSSFECGDAGVVRTDADQCFIGLVDGLGHGKEAYEVACLACDYLEERVDDDLVVTMRGLHEALKGTRGVVAALCRLDVHAGDLAYVGIGNICVKIIGPRAFTFVPRDGVIGYVMPTPREERRSLYSGDILVLTSDGIKEHFDPLDCPGLFNGDAESIAQGLLKQFGKEDDDASCIALRYWK